MQGVIKSYDPVTGDGIVMCDSDYRSYDIAPQAIAGSVFRMLRQGRHRLFRRRRGGPGHLALLGIRGRYGDPGVPDSEFLPGAQRPS